MHRAASLSRVYGVLAMAALTLAAAPAAPADRIEMRYEIFGLLGLRVLTLHTSFEEAGERYSVSADYATAGLAGFFVEQKTHAVANGQLGAGTASPSTFRNDTRRNGIERHSRVNYRPDGSLEGNSAPPPHNVVPPAAQRGTVDNLTAYLKLERQLAAKGTCALTVPVFDGRHRYDLVFTDAGRQTLSAEGGQKFKGDTVACRMVRHDRVVDEAEKDEGAKSGTVWYARLVNNNAVIPVRMKLDTLIGSVDAYLAEVRGGGVELKLME